MCHADVAPERLEVRARCRERSKHRDRYAVTPCGAKLRTQQQIAIAEELRAKLVRHRGVAGQRIEQKLGCHALVRSRGRTRRGGQALAILPSEEVEALNDQHRFHRFGGAHAEIPAPVPRDVAVTAELVEEAAFDEKVAARCADIVFK